MATKTSKWARLRHVALEEPREADSALAEVAEALGTMADALSNLRDNLDLVEAPKSASIKVRIAAARKYATRFRQIANEAPEVVADAISEVYHSLDDVAGALENFAEHMGIDLNLTPAEAAFGEEGQEELGGELPEETGESEIDDSTFEEGAEELESPEAKPAEKEFDEVVEKEAAAIEFVTDRDEEGKPKSPVVASKGKGATPYKTPTPGTRKCESCKTKPYKETMGGRKLCRDCAEDARERKAAAAAGSTGFVTDRDENGEPKAPEKLEIPQAQGSTEVGKAAARREATRLRIAKRHGIEL